MQTDQWPSIAEIRFGCVVGGLFRCAEDVFASSTLQVVQDFPVQHGANLGTSHSTGSSAN